MTDANKAVNNDIWDDPDIAATLPYAKFEHKGDTVAGRILEITKQEFEDDNGRVKVVPQLLLDTAEGEVGVTAGQTNLRAQLIEARPVVGDAITITLVTEPRKGRQKEFDVIINSTKN